MNGERTINATAFNRRIGAFVDAVRTGKETLIVANHGRSQIVIIPIDRYERLLAAEYADLMRDRAENEKRP